MTKPEAIEKAKSLVRETKQIAYVIRRGKKYDSKSSHDWIFGSFRGWKVSEMIGPGNIHNY